MKLRMKGKRDGWAVHGCTGARYKISLCPAGRELTCCMYTAPEGSSLAKPPKRTVPTLVAAARAAGLGMGGELSCQLLGCRAAGLATPPPSTSAHSSRRLMGHWTWRKALVGGAMELDTGWQVCALNESTFCRTSHFCFDCKENVFSLLYFGRGRRFLLFVLPGTALASLETTRLGSALGRGQQ